MTEPHRIQPDRPSSMFPTPIQGNILHIMETVVCSRVHGVCWHAVHPINEKLCSTGVVKRPEDEDEQLLGPGKHRTALRAQHTCNMPAPSTTSLVSPP